MGTRALLAAALAVLAVVAVVPGSSARALANTWTGTWDTEWGVMALTQTGSQVKGTYPHDTGHIAGTVTGNLFKGRWTELPTRKGPSDAGAVELTMSADGKTLKGRWTYDGSPTSWNTNWNGTCTTGACARNTSAAGSGGSSPPPTATPTGTVLVNGVPFVERHDPVRLDGRRYERHARPQGRCRHPEGERRRRRLRGLQAPARQGRQEAGRRASPHEGRLQRLSEAEAE